MASCIAALPAVVAALAVPVQAQPPDVDALLEKAADSVAGYERASVGVVAGEAHRQEARGRAGSDARGFAVEAPTRRRNLGIFRTAAAFLALAACLTPSSAADEPALGAVLARAGAYVADFHRQLSSIVAEERYVQDWRAVWTGSNRRGTADLAHRELRSDLVLVKPDAAPDWLQFRDVFDVDGIPVRDRSERLTRLFLEPSRSAESQISRIREESARYNVGDIERNLNTPVFALKFLMPANQPRFRFKRTNDRATAAIGETPDRTGAFRISTEVWVIQFEEVRRQTMIHTRNNKDLPAKGRFWIEPATGRVLMSELVAENREIRGTIDVSYQSEPLLGLLVPIEMRERYEGRRNNSLIEGRATYGRFRQFQVNTDEKFLIKK